MSIKKPKNKFNEPTPTPWIACSRRDTEYPSFENWTVEGNAFKTEDVDGDPFTFRPLIAKIEFGRTNAERKANAQLISASREMLEALRVMQVALKAGNINKHSQHVGSWRTYASIIKEAINKAEGKK